MRERDLAAACASWLGEQGFEVYGEVEPVRSLGNRFDLVGLRGDDVWVLETKTALSIDLRRQAQAAMLYGTKVFVGVPWRRRPIPVAGEPGGFGEEDRYGVLYVHGSSVFVARAARPPRCTEPDYWERHVRETRESCSRHLLGFAGGQTSSESIGRPTPFRVFQWELHRVFWGREWFDFGEAVEAAKRIDTGYAWQNSKAMVLAMLTQRPGRDARCFETLFPRESEPGYPGPIYRATGIGVPDDCAPGRIVPAPIPVEERSTISRVTPRGGGRAR